MSEPLLKIGEVARRAGVSRRTVDFYTRLGFVEPSGRTEGNYRLYTQSAVDQIQLVRKLEEHGIRLQEISHAMRGGSRKEIEGSLKEIDREIHALRKAVRSLKVAGGAGATGLLYALAEKLRSLAETALEITGGSGPPAL